MTVAELEQIVGAEWDSLNRIAATRPMTTELGLQYEILREKLVSHERELCLARQLPVALRLVEWTLRWTRCHDKIRLSSTEEHVQLNCYTYDVRPDMFTDTVISFDDCVASCLMRINYDELEEHSMYHSGLEGLGAYLVENSQWKRDVCSNIKCHNHIHFMFCFDSCLVETIARGLHISLGEARRGTPPRGGL